jgi:sec-independent protein translocase protein TatB
MNFMGMGVFELAVILLVAFLVLGPGRSIDMARSAGKLLGDLRRSFSDVTSAVSVEVDNLSKNQPQRPEGSKESPRESSPESTPGVPMRPDTPADEAEDELSPGQESEEKG